MFLCLLVREGGSILGGQRKSDKYRAAYAGKYKSKYGRDAQQANSRRLIIVISIVFTLLFIVGVFASCENVKHVEAMEGYTQIKEEFIEEASLVDIEGFYAGTGELNGITHLRFVAEKNGIRTDTVDVTKRFFSIIYTDSDTANAQDKKLEGRVKAYKRTYEKDKDVKTHYYYVLYSSKSKIKDVGELASE
jgi:hypothetical protein